MWKYDRYSENGYEVSSRGDTRFSPLFAKLADGRTIEEAYQLDVKGYRALGYTNWRLVKGKPPRDKTLNLWGEYLALWQQWARENPFLIERLAIAARGLVLTDMFATGSISQARALAHILNERQSCREPSKRLNRRSVI